MATPTLPLGADFATGTGNSLTITPSASSGKLLIVTEGALSAHRPEPPAQLRISVGGSDIGYATMIDWCGGSPQAKLPVTTGGNGQYVAFYWFDNPTSGVVNTINDLALGGIPASYRNTAAWVVYGEPVGRPRHFRCARDDSGRRSGVTTVTAYTLAGLDVFETGDVVLIGAANDTSSNTTFTITSSLAGTVTLGATTSQTSTTPLLATSASYIPSATGVATLTGTIGGGSPTLTHMMAVVLRGTGYTPVNWISIDSFDRAFRGHNEVSLTLSGSYELAAGATFSTLEFEDYDPLNGTVNSTWTAHAVTLDAVNQRWASTTPWTLPDDGRHMLRVRMKDSGTVIATSQRQWRPLAIGEVLNSMGSSSADLGAQEPQSSTPDRLPKQEFRSFKYDPNYTGIDKFVEDAVGAVFRGTAFQLLRILDRERGHNRSSFCVIDGGFSGSSSADWNQDSDPLMAAVIAADAAVGGADIHSHIGTVTNSIRSVTNFSGKASKANLKAEMDTVYDRVRAHWPTKPFMWGEANRFPVETGTCTSPNPAICEVGAKPSYENLVWYNEIMIDYEAADANFYKGPGTRFGAMNGIHMADGPSLYYGQALAYLYASILLGDVTLRDRGPQLVSVTRESATSLLFTFDRSITSSRRGLTGVTGAVVATDSTYATLFPPANYTQTITGPGERTLRVVATSGNFTGYTYAGYGLGAGTGVEADMTNCVASAREDGVEWMGTDAVVGYCINSWEDTTTTHSLNLATATLFGGRVIEQGDYIPVTFQQGINGNPTPPSGWNSGVSDVIGNQVTTNWGGAGPGQTSGARLWMKRIRESEKAGLYTFTGISNINGRAKMLFGPIIRGSTRSVLAFSATVTGADFTDSDGWTKQSGSRSFVAVIWGLPTMVGVTPPAGWETILAPTLVGSSGKDWLVSMFILRNTDDYVNGSAVSFTGMSGTDPKAGYIVELFRA